MTQREEELEERIKELERVRDATEGLFGIMRLHAHTLAKQWEREPFPTGAGDMCYRPRTGWAMVDSAVGRALEYVRITSYDDFATVYKQIRKSQKLVITASQDDAAIGERSLAEVAASFFDKRMQADMVFTNAPFRPYNEASQDLAINDSLQQVDKCDEQTPAPGGRWKRQ